MVIVGVGGGGETWWREGGWREGGTGRVCCGRWVSSVRELITHTDGVVDMPGSSLPLGRRESDRDSWQT